MGGEAVMSEEMTGIRQAVVDAIAQYGSFEEMIEGTAGCTVSCHCGPETLGILFVRK